MLGRLVLIVDANHIDNLRLQFLGLVLVLLGQGLRLLADFIELLNLLGGKLLFLLALSLSLFLFLHSNYTVIFKLSYAFKSTDPPQHTVPPYDPASLSDVGPTFPSRDHVPQEMENIFVFKVRRLKEELTEMLCYLNLVVL